MKMDHCKRLVLSQGLSRVHSRLGMAIFHFRNREGGLEEIKKQAETLVCLIEDAEKEEENEKSKCGSDYISSCDAVFV